MNDPNLDAVVGRMAALLAAATRHPTRSTTGTPSPTGLADAERTIARELLREALRNGVMEEALTTDFADQRAGSGSTADSVAFVTQPLALVFKADRNPKLVREARMLQAAAARDDLPRSTRGALPRVFAVKDDGPPYAYIMRQFRGYANLADLLVRHVDDLETCWGLTETALAPLLEAYRETAAREEVALSPNLDAIHFARLRRLHAAQDGPDRELASLLDRPAVINGRGYPAFTEFYTWFERSKRAILADLTPPVTTFVHGDPNPENLLLGEPSAPGGPWRVGLIDPKDWGEGDYVFDFAKVTHYLQVTWPVEKGAALSGLALASYENRWTLDYSLRLPPAIAEVVARVEAMLGTFAISLAAGGRTPDPTWKLRYRLSLASNLLGLPVNRFRIGRRESALVMLAEGIQQAALFREAFERWTSART